MHIHSIPRAPVSGRTLSISVALSALFCAALLGAAVWTLATAISCKDLERDALLVLARWQTMDSLAHDVLLKRASVTGGGACELLDSWEKESLGFSLALARFNDQDRLASLSPSVAADARGAVSLWLLSQRVVVDAQGSLRSMLRSGLAARVMVNGFLQTYAGLRKEGLLSEAELVAIQDLVYRMDSLDSATAQFDQRLRAVVSRVSSEAEARIRRTALFSALSAAAAAFLGLAIFATVRSLRRSESRRREEEAWLRRDSLRALFGDDPAEAAAARRELGELGASAPFAPVLALCLFRADGSSGASPAGLVPFAAAWPGRPERFAVDGALAVLADGRAGADACFEAALAVQAAAAGAGLSLSFALLVPLSPASLGAPALASASELLARGYCLGPGAALRSDLSPPEPLEDYAYPQRLEDLFVKRLLEGDDAEARAALDRLLDSARPFAPATARAAVARASSAFLGALERAERSGAFRLSPASLGRLSGAAAMDSLDAALAGFASVLDEISALRSGRDREDRLRGIVARIDALVDARYAERDLSLDRLAESLGLSPGYAGRLYRASTGRSVADAIAEKRLDASLALLAEGQLTIEGLAGEVGLGNAGGYYRLFKARYGLTPAEYRERLRAAETVQAPG